jgi:hypothetical protein
LEFPKPQLPDNIPVSLNHFVPPIPLDNDIEVDSRNSPVLDINTVLFKTELIPTLSVLPILTLMLNNPDALKTPLPLIQSDSVTKLEILNFFVSLIIFEDERPLPLDQNFNVSLTSLVIVKLFVPVNSGVNENSSLPFTHLLDLMAPLFSRSLLTETPTVELKIFPVDDPSSVSENPIVDDILLVAPIPSLCPIFDDPSITFDTVNGDVNGHPYTNVHPVRPNASVICLEQTTIGDGSPSVICACA